MVASLKGGVVKVLFEIEVVLGVGSTYGSGSSEATTKCRAHTLRAILLISFENDSKEAFCTGHNACSCDFSSRLFPLFHVHDWLLQLMIMIFQLST